MGGLGGWRDILYRDGIGIGMGMSIRRVIGMTLFMGRIREGLAWLEGWLSLVLEGGGWFLLCVSFQHG